MTIYVGDEGTQGRLGTGDLEEKLRRFGWSEEHVAQLLLPAGAVALAAQGDVDEPSRRIEPQYATYVARTAGAG